MGQSDRVTDEVTNRSATPSYAPAVRDVIERAIRRSAKDLYSPEQIDAWAGGRSNESVRLMIEQTVAFVAVSEARVVGFTNLAESEVDQLYVDPEVGGRGIARLLYEAVEEEARARRLPFLTATASLRAEPAFVAFGFRPVSRIERPFGGQTFAVCVMQKDAITVSA
jgi:putative acetyltransferase